MRYKINFITTFGLIELSIRIAKLCDEFPLKKGLNYLGVTPKQKISFQIYLSAGFGVGLLALFPL
nr:hypothetical protein [uncultured Flavobacterium sp.]